MTRRPKLKHNSFPLVLVEWQDALTDSGWSTTTEFSPALIRSIGWKISDTDKALILASDIGDETDSTTKTVTTETNRRIAIPKDWVTKETEIK